MKSVIVRAFAGAIMSVGIMFSAEAQEPFKLFDCACAFENERWCYTSDRHGVCVLINRQLRPIPL